MAAKLKKFLLRYYPPGIILQYERDGVMKQKPIDLLDLTPDIADIEVLLSQIIRQEPLISENRRPALRQLINRLIDKMLEQQHHSFTLFKVLRAHILPLTNCAFNKSGDRFITGSYDRTCKAPTHALDILKPTPPPTPAVRAGTLVVSGSIDCTSRLWDVRSGRCLSVKQGHTDEVLDVAFDSAGTKFVSASADGTSRLYNTLTGVCQHTMVGHEGEISKVAFNPQVLEGHTDEIFSCAFNYEGDFIITGSKDNTCRIWKALTASSQTLSTGGSYHD
ncbi:Outer row dynein assembly protein 16 [Tetrabaena socialis]|uniref:Outer row dynein assembly protein 16 n=1 Tax=Tetrabaena socialis TaxID=47790 RepID=A0A2J8A2J5_9CHLO|nr:Outer row dynein assembly protein 16 [Tetrabaena socialis]|eukprot:PNH06746.1 Outer row dynein assembly protein 16 [Tetrabaena socialis]